MARTSLARELANQAFSRAGGAQLSRDNAVRLLRDARENYPAWLEAIAGAERHVHFECYIIRDDAVGRRFAEALAAKAAEGVKVRVIYDWLGGFGAAGVRFWRELRTRGVDVRCFNPPRLDQPLGWMHRDHRKCLVVDDGVAFVSGLCVGQPWEGDAAKGIAPWRDTGVELRGPAVHDVSLAFADSWASIGTPLPPEEIAKPAPAAGAIALRIVANTAGTGGIFRLDSLVTALARKSLWLADAYYAGTSVYTESLRAAARDGVDVRLLVPGRGSDVRIVQAVSRAGYRSLLEAGVRVFEWNGPMMHAKTAVADGRWARVGSTNLNLSSWIGNRELDVVVEDDGFADAMEDAYLEDLQNATEIVLNQRFKVRSVATERRRRVRGAGGSAGRAAASALRLGNVLGAAMTSRVLGPAESRLMAKASIALLLLAPLGIVWPRLFAWPLTVFLFWMGCALLLGAWRSRRARALAEAMPGASAAASSGAADADTRARSVAGGGS